MEDKRVQVTNEQLSEHFHQLFEFVSDVPHHSVSSEVNEKQAYVPVTRARKRITLMARIAADGSSRKPMIIISRNN
jgi:hypothetical protein